MRQLWKLILWWALVIDGNSVDGKKNHKSVIFLSTQVAFNPEYISEHKLIINPDRMSLNVTLNIRRNFPYDAWSQSAAMIGSGTSARTLLSYDLNVCEILGRSKSHKLNMMQIWINNFLKYGNLPRHCPIEKGDYFFHNLRPDKMNIPTFFLNGKYLLLVNTYFRKEPTSTVWADSVANLTIQIIVK